MFPPETKVLVIDDMSTMRKFVCKALKTLGLTNLTEADDGATAWPMLQKASQENVPFQLVVSDWNMPKMKGLDLLKNIRADAKLAPTPFLMVTAEAEMKQVMEALKAGVDNYVVKPFTVETLTEKLTQIYVKKNKKK